MRASFELVRRHPALIWFPVISTCCLVLSAGFWIFDGAWLHAVNAAWFLYVPLVAVGRFSWCRGFCSTWTRSCSSAGTSIRLARRRCSASSCSAGSPCRPRQAWSGRCSQSSCIASRPAEARKSRWPSQPVASRVSRSLLGPCHQFSSNRRDPRAKFLPSLDVRGAQFGRVGNHVDLGDSATGDRETDHCNPPLGGHDDHARGPVHDCRARVGGKSASALKHLS